MECYEVESLLADYLDVQLHPDKKMQVEQHLKQCASCRQALEEYSRLFALIQKDTGSRPGPVLREKFESMLQDELRIEAATREADRQKVKSASRNIRPFLYQAAAGILLILMGYATAMLVTSQRGENRQVAELKNEIKEMKETLTVSLLNEESASERIRAVSYADELTEPDNTVLTALITVMNEDRNVNVRLAALYALAKFDNKNKVTEALVASLRTQKEPLMQIALINILTEKKETKAKAPIREILQDKNTLPPVKEIAQKGLKIL